MIMEEKTKKKMPPLKYDSVLMGQLSRVNSVMSTLRISYKGVESLKQSIGALEMNLAGHIKPPAGRIKQADIKELERLNRKLDRMKIWELDMNTAEKYIDDLKLKGAELVKLMVKIGFIADYPKEDEYA